MPVQHRQKGLASTHLAHRPWRKQFLEPGKTFDQIAFGMARKVV